ncbi:MAG: restriction endonuclease [Candidatus Helarchaeota archaeon]
MRLQIPSTFVNRNEEINILKNWANSSDSFPMVLVGPAGIGKTYLGIIFTQYLENNGWISIKYTPGNNLFSPAILLEDYKHKDIKNERVIVFIDDFDQVNHNSFSTLLDYFRKTLPNAKLLLAARPYTFQSIPPSFSNEVFNLLQLKSFSDEQIREFISKSDSSKKQFFMETINVIGEISKGNPLFLQLICSLIISGTYSLDQILNYSQNFSLDESSLYKSVSQIHLIKSDVRIVNSKLLIDLINDPKLLYDLSPRQFEEIIAELLEKLGYSVVLTPASRDGGKDIYAAMRNDLGSFLYLVECKKYSPNNRVGVEIIRQLHGVVQAERATAGILATTSFFTKGAEEFQRKLEYQLSLRDYFGIQEWLHSLAK